MADPNLPRDAAAPGSATTLRYTSPPEGWVEALPVGNGRLGAMVFAGTSRDRLQVNDDTCWSGSPRTDPVRGADLPPGGGPEVLRAARAALADGDVREAERQVMRLQGGYVESYQPLVDLWLTVPDGAAGAGRAADYRRWLDLGEATAGHSWTAGPAALEQEVFVSRPAGVLVLHRTGTAPMDVDVAVTSVHTLTGVEPGPTRGGADWSAVVRMPAAVLPDYIPATGTGVTPSPGPGHSITCAVAVRVLTDGRSSSGPDGVEIRGATWITVLLTSESDYADAATPLHGDDARLRAVARERLTAAADAGVPALREQHVVDHGALFGRVTLRLGPDDGHTRRACPRPPGSPATPRPTTTWTWPPWRSSTGAT